MGYLIETRVSAGSLWWTKYDEIQWSWSWESTFFTLPYMFTIGIEFMILSYKNLKDIEMSLFILVADWMNLTALRPSYRRVNLYVGRGKSVLPLGCAKYHSHDKNPINVIDKILSRIHGWLFKVPVELNPFCGVCYWYSAGAGFQPGRLNTWPKKFVNTHFTLHHTCVETFTRSTCPNDLLSSVQSIVQSNCHTTSRQDKRAPPKIIVTLHFYSPGL